VFDDLPLAAQFGFHLLHLIVAPLHARKPTAPLPKVTGDTGTALNRE
jgi:hypothetical protein